jgi:hypothetical protein
MTTINNLRKKKQPKFTIAWEYNNIKKKDIFNISLKTVKNNYIIKIPMWILTKFVDRNIIKSARCQLMTLEFNKDFDINHPSFYNIFNEYGKNFLVYYNYEKKFFDGNYLINHIYNYIKLIKKKSTFIIKNIIVIDNSKFGNNNNIDLLYFDKIIKLNKQYEKKEKCYKDFIIKNRYFKMKELLNNLRMKKIESINENNINEIFNDEKIDIMIYEKNIQNSEDLIMKCIKKLIEIYINAEIYEFGKKETIIKKVMVLTYLNILIYKRKDIVEKIKDWIMKFVIEVTKEKKENSDHDNDDINRIIKVHKEFIEICKDNFKNYLTNLIDKLLISEFLLSESENEIKTKMKKTNKRMKKTILIIHLIQCDLHELYERFNENRDSIKDYIKYIWEIVKLALNKANYDTIKGMTIIKNYHEKIKKLLILNKQIILEFNEMKKKYSNQYKGNKNIMGELGTHTIKNEPYPKDKIDLIYSICEKMYSLYKK